ncbi:hypothetical protein BJY00DRAFT_281707 [Aspergillus carlsbadensis]|nr:hypothetical protein BJY00DRAFT_281707 [Aspergillus carlsbadensis]
MRRYYRSYTYKDGDTPALSIPSCRLAFRYDTYLHTPAPIVQGFRDTPHGLGSLQHSNSDRAFRLHDGPGTNQRFSLRPRSIWTLRRNIMQRLRMGKSQRSSVEPPQGTKEDDPPYSGPDRCMPALKMQGPARTDCSGGSSYLLRYEPHHNRQRVIIFITWEIPTLGR